MCSWAYYLIGYNLAVFKSAKLTSHDQAINISSLNILILMLAGTFFYGSEVPMWALLDTRTASRPRCELTCLTKSYIFRMTSFASYVTLRI